MSTVQQSLRPEAVIFDMDGLMIDTEVIYHAAWRRAASELGYTLDDRLFHDLIGLRTEDCEAQIYDAMGRDFPLAEFQTLWEKYWDEHSHRVGIETKPGLFELLDLLEQLAIPKAVATSSTQDEAGRSLALTSLDQRFSIVVTGDQVENGKPAPDIYLEAARRLGVVPERCVALEDSSAGALAAANAGMHTLIIPDLKPPSTQARAAAVDVLSSLHEVFRLFA